MPGLLPGDIRKGGIMTSAIMCVLGGVVIMVCLLAMEEIDDFEEDKS